MKPKFFIFVTLFFLFSSFLFPTFSSETDEEISSDGIETLEETMKNLAGSFGTIPDAPRFEGQIQVPALEVKNKKSKPAYRQAGSKI